LSSSQSYYQTYSSYTPTAVHVQYVPQEIPICPTTPSPPEAEIIDEMNIWNPLFDNEVSLLAPMEYHVINFF